MFSAAPAMADPLVITEPAQPIMNETIFDDGLGHIGLDNDSDFVNFDDLGLVSFDHDLDHANVDHNSDHASADNRLDSRRARGAGRMPEQELERMRQVADRLTDTNQEALEATERMLDHEGERGGASL